jgi:hypothetical protein
VSSRFPVNGVDAVRFKKKKRRRKKKLGLLSRKNFIFNKGSNSWSLVGDYHIPPVKQPDLVVPKRKKRKKKVVVGNYSESARVRWALINRVNLDIKCSGFQSSVSCKLDRVKEANLRPGQAKKVCLSTEKVVDLFAMVSDAWDCFERCILCKFGISCSTSPPDIVVPDKLPLLGAEASVDPQSVVSLLRNPNLGRGRGACV